MTKYEWCEKRDQCETNAMWVWTHNLYLLLKQWCNIIASYNNHNHTAFATESKKKKKLRIEIAESFFYFIQYSDQLHRNHYEMTHEGINYAGLCAYTHTHFTRGQYNRKKRYAQTIAKLLESIGILPNFQTKHFARECVCFIHSALQKSKILANP